MCYAEEEAELGGTRPEDVAVEAAPLEEPDPPAPRPKEAAAPPQDAQKSRATPTMADLDADAPAAGGDRDDPEAAKRAADLADRLDRSRFSYAETFGAIGVAVPALFAATAAMVFFVAVNGFRLYRLSGRRHSKRVFSWDGAGFPCDAADANIARSPNARCGAAIADYDFLNSDNWWESLLDATYAHDDWSTLIGSIAALFLAAAMGKFVVDVTLRWRTFYDADGRPETRASLFGSADDVARRVETIVAVAAVPATLAAAVASRDYLMLVLLVCFVAVAVFAALRPRASAVAGVLAVGLEVLTQTYKVFIWTGYDPIVELTRPEAVYQVAQGRASIADDRVAGLALVWLVTVHVCASPALLVVHRGLTLRHALAEVIFSLLYAVWDGYVMFRASAATDLPVYRFVGHTLSHWALTLLPYVLMLATARRSMYEAGRAFLEAPVNAPTPKGSHGRAPAGDGGGRRSSIPNVMLDESVAEATASPAWRVATAVVVCGGVVFGAWSTHRLVDREGGREGRDPGGGRRRLAESLCDDDGWDACEVATFRWDWDGFGASPDARDSLAAWQNADCGPGVGGWCNLQVQAWMRAAGVGATWRDASLPSVVDGCLCVSPNPNAAHRGWTEVPESVWHRFANVRVLDLSGNALTGLSSDVTNHVALRTLTLNDNRLTALPEALRDLDDLETLSVDGNPDLVALPASLGDFPALGSLRAAGCGLTALPASLPRTLATLYVADNALAALPDGLGDLADLVHLDVSGNRLAALPDAIGGLANLNVLDARNNRLATVPDSIGVLKKLRWLAVGNANLVEVPDAICGCDALEVLVLTGSPRLRSVPACLAAMPNLRVVEAFGTGVCGGDPDRGEAPFVFDPLPVRTCRQYDGTPAPSGLPSPLPSPLPTPSPTTALATPAPSTAAPTILPTPQPSPLPTPGPSPLPTTDPSALPTPLPTPLPSLMPSTEADCVGDAATAVTFFTPKTETDAGWATLTANQVRSVKIAGVKIADFERRLADVPVLPAALDGAVASGALTCCSWTAGYDDDVGTGGPDVYCGATDQTRPPTAWVDDAELVVNA